MLWDNYNKEKFEVLTAVSTKMAVFWVVAPCSLLNVSEVLAASIIRAMSKPCAWNQFEI
jgi:hypothetical protein